MANRKAEKPKAEERVFIIKAKDPIIPWDKLTEDERVNLLIRELGDLIFKRRDFLRTIRILSELFTAVNRKEELQRILHGVPDRETINFLLSVNWIVPILSDVELVINVTKERKDVKVISRDYWQKKVNDAGPFGDLTDAVKPYENIDTSNGFVIRSGTSRFGVRDVDLDSYVNRNKLVHRTIAKNETIVIVGFVVDLKRAFSDSLLFDQSFRNLNFTQLFKSQFPLTPVSSMSVFRFTEEEPYQKQVPKIMDAFLLIEDYKRFSRNTIEYNTEQLDANLRIQESVAELKEHVPESITMEREERVPTWMLISPKIISSIYGNYSPFGTLADIAEQREYWTTKSYVGNIPFYVFLTMLKMLSVSDGEQVDIKEKIKKLNQEFEKSYVLLEAALAEEERQLEKSWTSKILDFYKKECESQKSESQVCKKTKGSSVDREIAKFRIETLVSLFERFNNLVDNAKLYRQVKKQQAKFILAQKDRDRRRDTYEQAIAEQLSPFVLEKLKEESEAKAITIEETLTTRQRNLVEKYIEEALALRKNYENNKCPHFKLRAEYDSLLSLDEKFAVYQRMISTFGPKSPDPETRYLFCNNCHFNMGCQHEVIMMERHGDRNREEELTKVLEDEYYSKRSTGPRAEYIACKFCGRKIAESAIEEQIAFDEDGVKITGVVIEREDDEIIMLRNLAASIMVHASLQGAVNSRKLVDEIGMYILDRWTQIEKQELGTEDTQLLKRLHATAFIYAKLIKDMIATSFRFRFRKEYLPGARADLPKDTLNPYILAVLKIVRDRDREFFDQLGLKEMKVKFSSAIKSAFKTLQKAEFKKDIATFTLARRIWGATWSPDAFAKEGDLKKTRKQIDNITKKDDNLTIYKALFDAAKIQLWKIKELFRKPVQDPAWLEVSRLFNNRRLNKLYDALVYNRVPKKYNRRYLKYVKLTDLEPPKNDPYFYYTLDKYCENGSPQNWDLTKLVGVESGKKALDIKTSDLKRKLKAQKTAFDMGFEPDTNIEYFSISPDVNVTNINQFKRELFNTKCGGMSKKEAQEKESRRGPKDHQKLKEKVFELEELNEIKDVIANACAGAPGQFLYWGTDVLCGIAPSKKLLDKVQKGLQKEREKQEIVKDIPVFIVKQPKVPADFKVKREEITFDRTLAEEVIKKISKFININSGELMTSFVELGKFKNRFEEQMIQIEREIFKSKEQKEKALKTLKRDQNWSRIAELNNIIRRLQRDYRLIRTSETDIFLNSPSLFYLSRYIDEKKKSDFKDELPAKFNVLNYYDIEHADGLSLSRRIVMFLNIFLGLLNTIVQSKLSAEFVIEFMKRVKEDNELADTTNAEVDLIRDQLDLQKRKNLEKFLKMTPEEKVAKGFFEAGLEEQIELLNEESKKVASEEDDRAIENYKAAQDTDKFAQTLDDEQSYDDDDVFITDSFEVYQ